MEVVYFAQSRATSLVKIGYSANIERRLKALANTTPSGVSLMFSIPGGWELEQAIHDELEDVRENGEWFANGPKLTGLIDRLKAHGQRALLADFLPAPDGVSKKFDYADLLPKLVAAAASPVSIRAERKSMFELAARRSGLSYSKCYAVFYGRAKTLNIEDFNALRSAALKHTEDPLLIRLLMTELMAQMEAVVEKAEILHAEGAYDALKTSVDDGGSDG